MQERLDRKVLTISQPPISTFFNTDIPLTILYGDVETHPWIFSNYIQLYSINNIAQDNPCFIDFYHSENGIFRFLELTTCPWILFERISRKDVIEKWGGIINFITEQINQGKYIGLTIDPSKISNYRIGTKRHNLFIYGFDNFLQTAYTADHFRKGIYTFEEVAYKELINSVKYSYEEDLDWGNLEGICILTKMKRIHITHENSYKLNLLKIIQDIKYYLLEEGYMYKNDKYNVYGIACYDNLIKYYKLVLEEKGDINLKGIHTETCHKTMMVKRLKFLTMMGYPIKQYISLFEMLEKKLKVLTNLSIKYNITFNEIYLEKCIQDLEMIKEQEKNMLGCLVKDFIKIL
ncbi:MAG: hypothetical protein AB9856_09070 [Cellulosilyticaceae bacterium]